MMTIISYMFFGVVVIVTMNYNIIVVKIIYTLPIMLDSTFIHICSKKFSVSQ